MKFCTFCGSQTADDAIFCDKCGKLQGVYASIDEKKKAELESQRARAQKMLDSSEKMKKASDNIGAFGSAWMKMIFWFGLVIIIIFVTKSCLSGL